MENVRRTAGRKGGLATKAKYKVGDPNHYSKIGKLGGRPPVKSIAEIQATRQQDLESPANTEEGRPPNNMQELRVLFNQRHGDGK